MIPWPGLTAGSTLAFSRETESSQAPHIQVSKPWPLPLRDEGPCREGKGNGGPEQGSRDGGAGSFTQRAPRIDLCTQREVGRVDSLRCHVAFQGRATRGAQSWKTHAELELLLLAGREARGTQCPAAPDACDLPSSTQGPRRDGLGAEPLSHSRSMCEPKAARRKPRTPSSIPTCVACVPLYKFN